MHDKLKKTIFDKLYNDLKNVEIIPYQDSIWFIDREKKYWYLEYEESETLWWNYHFFTKFFMLFSLEMDEYKPIISEWAEEVLNFKVKTSQTCQGVPIETVEEALNYKVNESNFCTIQQYYMVKAALDYKVDESKFCTAEQHYIVRAALDYKVQTTSQSSGLYQQRVEEVLNQNK